ncbi:MAG: 3-oxoacyl-(acyl-carrier-protein) synthase [Acidobacteria bacterium]|nr:3-oxoacyl-(acyl-carrier-protein) synthase [Acidobacteriota bacterium]
MVKRRVVVTGVGLITPLGTGLQETWQGLLAGKSGAGPITHFDAADFPTRIAAEVKDFNPAQFADRKDIKKMDTFIHYAIAASEFALKDAGLSRFDKVSGERAGVVIGSGIGGFGTIEREHEILLKQGPRRMSPFFIPSSIINLAAGQVSIRYGARGPNSAPCTACSSGSHAIGDSFRMIERGDADVMIAGGSEAAITPMAIGGFDALKALSTRNDAPAKASRPFDRERDGFVLGEGAGILILEELERARSRNAAIYCEIVGYGMSGDAYHITAPTSEGDGPARAMRATLRDAGIEASAIDYINAHGTSTPPNDRAETAAIRSVFGEHAYKLAVSSTKSMIGHLLGAAGAVEAGIVALTIRDQIIHPTINLEYPDPDCDLDYVPNVARRARVRYALSNSFGFGGTNACLLLKRCEP